MALHAREFFAELALPFTNSHVVGDTGILQREQEPFRIRALVADREDLRHL